MKLVICVVFGFLIASTGAFSFLPSFFESTPEEEKLPMDDNEVHDAIDNSYFPYGEDNTQVKSASSVLSELKNMLNSPFDNTKEYAAEKVTELVSKLEHDTSKVIWFTLGGVNMLVDLGIKGSHTRLRNVEEGKGLLAYIIELFNRFTSWIKSFFVAEETDDKSKKEPTQSSKDATHQEKEKHHSSKEIINVTPESSKNIDNQHASIQHTETLNTETKDKKAHVEGTNEQNTSEVETENKTDASLVETDNKHASHDETDKVNDTLHQVQEQPTNIEVEEIDVKKPKTVSNEVNVPLNLPAGLSPDEKSDVNQAHQEILRIEKTIQEIEGKSEQYDGRSSLLNQLKHQAEIKKKFIIMSTYTRLL